MRTTRLQGTESPTRERTGSAESAVRAGGGFEDARSRRSEDPENMPENLVASLTDEVKVPSAQPSLLVETTVCT